MDWRAMLPSCIYSEYLILLKTIPLLIGWYRYDLGGVWWEDGTIELRRLMVACGCWRWHKRSLLQQVTWGRSTTGYCGDLIVFELFAYAMCQPKQRISLSFPSDRTSVRGGQSIYRQRELLTDCYFMSMGESHMRMIQRACNLEPCPSRCVFPCIQVA